ncbi:MAG TPA: AI-2E family transporter [Candidatus Pelethosoma merdigallinarum]|nr:AI-2E family transporter [Candidatus Pelethosoma merdigallinarum]
MKNKEEKLNIKNLNAVIELGRKLLHITLILLLIIGIYAITLIFKEWHVKDFLFTVLKILSPLFIGFIVAWLFNPLVVWLNKKGINRTFGALIVYLVFIAIIALIINLIVPILYQQMGEFIKTIPAVLDTSKEWLEDTLLYFDNIKQIDIEYVKTVIFSNIENIATGITSDMPNRIISFIKGMFSGLGTLVIGLVIGFYLLISFDNTENLLSFLPKKSQKGTRDLLTAIDGSLRGFVQGAILDCSLIFVISSLAFALVGLRAPLLFGLFCGLTNIIPYAGPYIGGAPAVIVGFSQSPTIGIFTLLSIVLIQFVEGNFLQSLILSKTTKLHPVTIIIGLLIFGHFWGILGMAVSTPIISALKTLLLFLDERYDILKFN